MDDAANEALRAFLADLLKVPSRSIRIVSGDHSRSKRIAIDGLTLDDAKARIATR